MRDYIDNQAKKVKRAVDYGNMKHNHTFKW